MAKNQLKIINNYRKMLKDKKNPLAIYAEGNRWVGVGFGKYFT
jgi:hypothetical protein